MTNEVAIRLLQTARDKAESAGLREAIDRGIKALEQEPCDDAINRQAVLDKIQRLIDAEGNCHDENGNYLSYAQERVNSYEAIQQFVECDFLCPPVQPKANWIPASEKLPDTDDEVLVTYIVNGNRKKRYVETAYYYPITDEWNSINDEYRVPNTKVEIIAWQPLPKPYVVEPQESGETETWNGIHAQITAPKGTFDKIFNDTEEDIDDI